MAAECDCPAVCQCRVRSSTGTTVTGTGSQTQPITISLNLGGSSPNSCSQVLTCLAAHLGPGIAYDNVNNTFRVKISEDAGNQLRPSADGLLVSGTASTCRQTVASMLARRNKGRIVFGDRGAGVNHFPDNVLRSVRAAVDLAVNSTVRASNQYALEGVVLDVDGLTDGTPFLRWYMGDDIRHDLPGYPDATVDDLTDAAYENGYAGNIFLAGLQWTDLNIQALRNIQTNQGNFDSGGPPGQQWNFAHRWPGGLTPGEQGQVNTGPFNGGGISSVNGSVGRVGLDQLGGNTVAQLLSEVGDQIVIAYRMVRPSPATVTALRDSILRACAQQSSIVVSSSVSDTLIASNAGIQTGYLAKTTTDLASQTPAQLLAAGIDWLFADWRLPDAQVQQYAAAGLKVMQSGVSRRIHQTTVDTNGYYGVVSPDATYYAGLQNPLVQDLWYFGNMTSGQLHPAVEDSPYIHRYRGRVRMTDSGGLGYLPRCGGPPYDTTKFCGWNPDTDWETEVGNQSDNAVTILGWACPISNPTSYSIAWSMIWNSLPRNPNSAALEYGAGMVLGLTDDTGWIDTALPQNYYYLRQVASGQLAVRRRMNGAVTDATPSTSSGNVTTNVWYHFKATVSATGVKFERYDRPATVKNGSTPVLQQTCTFTETAAGPRGLYLGLRKYQDGKADRFSVGWGNFEYVRI